MFPLRAGWFSSTAMRSPRYCKNFCRISPKTFYRILMSLCALVVTMILSYGFFNTTLRKQIQTARLPASTSATEIQVILTKLLKSSSKIPSKTQSTSSKPTVGLRMEWKPKDWNQMKKKENMEKRLKHLESRCERLDLYRSELDSIVNPNEFFINQNYHLVGCNVFQSAAGSMFSKINLFNNTIKTSQDKSNMDADAMKEQEKRVVRADDIIRNAFPNSLSFIVVSNPLERLIFNYKTILENNEPEYKNIRDEILGEMKKKTDDAVPTFSEFINHVIKVYLDKPWSPVELSCLPCNLKFQVIIHTETFKEDLFYLIKSGRLDKLVASEWKNLEEVQFEWDLETFYSQLTMDQIMQIYQIFWFDFVLFDYSVKEYIKHGKST